MSGNFSEILTPLDRLGRRIDSNLLALKNHGRYLASDLENLETNLVLMFQALSMQDVAIFQATAKQAELEKRLKKLEANLPK